MEKATEVEELDEIEDNEPMIGMSFDSDTEIFIYYKEYGKKKGFPILRRSSKKDSDGVLRNVTFACGRSGETRSKSVNILRPQPNAKTGCNARLGASLGEDGKWRIRSLDLEHNHVLLTPTKSRFFRCNRSLSTYAKKKLDINDRAGIKLSKNYQSLVIEDMQTESENLALIKLITSVNRIWQPTESETEKGRGICKPRGYGTVGDVINEVQTPATYRDTHGKSTESDA